MMTEVVPPQLKDVNKAAFLLWKESGPTINQILPLEDLPAMDILTNFQTPIISASERLWPDQGESVSCTSYFDRNNNFFSLVINYPDGVHSGELEEVGAKYGKIRELKDWKTMGSVFGDYWSNEPTSLIFSVDDYNEVWMTNGDKRTKVGDNPEQLENIYQAFNLYCDGKKVDLVKVSTPIAAATEPVGSEQPQDAKDLIPLAVTFLSIVTGLAGAWFANRIKRLGQKYPKQKPISPAYSPQPRTKHAIAPEALKPRSNTNLKKDQINYD